MVEKVEEFLETALKAYLEKPYPGLPFSGLQTSLHFCPEFMTECLTLCVLRLLHSLPLARQATVTELLILIQDPATWTVAHKLVLFPYLHAVTLRGYFHSTVNGKHQGKPLLPFESGNG